MDNSSIQLLIPYFPGGKQLIIYNEENEKVLEIPVLQFADTCGNNVCDPQESYESCPADCVSGGTDDYCDSIADNICDPDCLLQQDTDCLIQSPFFALAILIVLIIVAAAAFYYMRKRKKE